MHLIKTVAICGIFSLALAGGAQASGGKAHWGYEGNEGPAHWGEISHDYHTCKDGKYQSPIDITNAQKGKLGKISFSYRASPKNIVNNGHSIQVNMNEGSTITVGGKTYKLLQFHFHSPSEHTINGKPAAMVAHFVHQAKDGQLGVIGVLINTGKANKVIGQLWKNLPTSAGESKDLTGKINVKGLLPKNKAYYNYTGSLTTPPCSEGVNWMVMETPIQVSEAQLKTFNKIFNGNVRPIQPLDGRHVKASM